MALLPASAWALRPTFRLSQGGRANVRESGANNVVRSEIVTRGEVDLAQKEWWRALPFIELRRDADRGAWSRVELGAEFGFKPFPNLIPPFCWFYVGHSLHQAWVSPGRDHPEWEIRTLFDFPFPLIQVGSRKASIFLLNEYTYDFRRGAGIRNEASAGLRVPLPLPRFSFLLGWKHVDPVHFRDMDQVEASLLVEF